MRKKIIFSLLIFISMNAYGQTFFDHFKPTKDSLPSYPVFGKFAVIGTGQNYIMIEFWVYDKNNKIVYNTIQNIPSAEIFAEFISKMVDQGYREHMMKHGLELKKRPNFNY